MNRVGVDALALFFYCSLIFWLSNQPTLPMPMLFPHQDKLHHLAAYAVMGWLAWRTFCHRCSGGTLWIFSLLFCSLYGVSDEFHQSFIEGRNADWLDWVADTLGSLLVVTILFIRRREESISTI